MARRHAVLMKLKDGITNAEARELAAVLRKLADPQWLQTRDPIPFRENGQACVRYSAPRQKTDKEIIREYDDEYGDPTFYIP